MKTICIYSKSIYGAPHLYVAAYLSDEMAETARQIEALTGRKTLSRGDIAALKGLGFEFKTVSAPHALIPSVC